MVIDTSAILAILLDEPDAESFESAIEADPLRLLSAGSFFEAAIVVESRFGPPGGRELDLMVHKAGLEIVAFDAGQVELARHAFRTYGKGRHQAGLNFGDCFAYALSKASGELLLFKGNDFIRTDIRPALPPPPTTNE
jgi:ribonuclease VapC